MLYEDLKTLYEVTEADLKNIRQIGIRIVPAIDEFIEQEYKYIHSILGDEFNEYFPDKSSLKRAQSLAHNAWLEFFQARWDENYIQSRIRIGEVHAKINLHPLHYLASMNKALAIWSDLACAMAVDIENLAQLIESMWRVGQMESALVVDVYTRRLNEIIYENKSLTSKVDSISKDLTFLALYNDITKYPNINSLKVDAEEILSQIKKGSASRFAIILIQLNNLDDINYLSGRSISDAFLIALINRLNDIFLDPGAVYHIAPDKFAIMMTSIESKNIVIKKIEAIKLALETGVLIENNPMHANLTMGICMVDNKYNDIEQVIAHAESALSEAKKAANEFVFYDDNLEFVLKERILTTKYLRYAIEFNQLFLNFQPQINVENGKVIGMEALIRWNHPIDGIKFPGQFIPFAENTELIIQIGDWVVRECCRQLNEWIKMGIEPPLLSLNISPYQIKNQHNFIELLQSNLSEFKISPYMLEIEITENALLDAPDIAYNIFQHIRNLGFRIALDDFGTGFASLDYLSKFPVDRIKISQNFVSQITESPRDMAIIETTLSLAKKLNLEIIVEGVETREQLKILSSLGCREYQGYYFYKPMSESQMRELIANRGPQSSILFSPT